LLYQLYYLEYARLKSKDYNPYTSHIETKKLSFDCSFGGHILTVDLKVFNKARKIECIVT